MQIGETPVPQLTALAVVSRNDYHKNIYSLGPAANFSIIKEIGSSPGNIALKRNGGFFWAFSAKCYFTNRVLILITSSFLIDAQDIVAAYLTHGQVKVKNTKEETFGNSIRVFILLQQDRAEPLAQESRAQQLFRVLQDKFKELCIKHETLKNIRAAGAKER